MLKFKSFFNQINQSFQKKGSITDKEIQNLDGSRFQKWLFIFLMKRSSNFKFHYEDKAGQRFPYKFNAPEDERKELTCHFTLVKYLDCNQNISSVNDEPKTVTGIIHFGTDGDLSLEVDGKPIGSLEVRITRATEAEVLKTAADFLSKIVIASAKHGWLIENYSNAIKELIVDLSENYNKFDKDMGNQSLSFEIMHEEEIYYISI